MARGLPPRSRDLSSSPETRRVRLLGANEIELVVDVGANVGQYALRLRAAGFKGQIVSFEPQSAQFAQLGAKAAGDARWECHRVALGDTDGFADIHIARYSGSSSLLPRAAHLIDRVPESEYVGTERVRRARLDSLWDDLGLRGKRCHLKLDVQGYELHVLRGAEAALTSIELVEAELSLFSLYEGAPLFDEVTAFLAGRGFRLASFGDHLEDMTTGEVLHFDGIFARRQV